MFSWPFSLCILSIYRLIFIEIVVLNINYKMFLVNIKVKFSKHYDDFWAIYRRLRFSSFYLLFSWYLCRYNCLTEIKYFKGKQMKGHIFKLFLTVPQKMRYFSSVIIYLKSFITYLLVYLFHGYWYLPQNHVQKNT